MMTRSPEVRTWRVNPPELMTWISAEQQKRAIALFDFEPDVLPSGDVRIDLRVAFRCIPVRHEGTLQHVDFYVGCQSASISIEATQGSLADYTPDTHLTVNYKDTHTRTRSCKVLVEPSHSSKSPAGESELTFGGISFDAGGQSQFERSFAVDERVLAAVCLGNSVEWRLDVPQERQVIRDFLYCNLHVYALCRYKDGRHQGTIAVRPSDVTFFDSMRRPLSRSKSMLMFYLLHRRDARYSVHAAFQ